MDFAALYRAERARLKSKPAPADEPSGPAGPETAETAETAVKAPLRAPAPPLPPLALAPRTPVDLRSFAVGRVSDVFYVPNFVTEAEERAMLAHVGRGEWTRLACRSLQCFGASVDGGRPSAPLPPWLRTVAEAVARATGAFDAFPGRVPDHALINEYAAGQGILPHSDGPRYEPVVATLSLGSPCLLSFCPHVPVDAPPGVPRNVVAQSVALRPRSLLVFRGAAYADHLHGIADVEAEVARAPTVVNLDAAGLVDGGTVRRGSPPRVSITLRRTREL